MKPIVPVVKRCCLDGDRCVGCLTVAKRRSSRIDGRMTLPHQRMC